MSSKRNEHIPYLNIIAAEGVAEETIGRPFQDAKATEAARDDDSQTSLRSDQEGPASSMPRLITDVLSDVWGRKTSSDTDEVTKQLGRL